MAPFKPTLKDTLTDKNSDVLSSTALLSENKIIDL